MTSNKNYDLTQEETYGVLLDANNFYGGIMEKCPLPLNNFTTVNLDSQHILETPNDSSIGYILDVFHWHQLKKVFHTMT